MSCPRRWWLSHTRPWFSIARALWWGLDTQALGPAWGLSCPQSRKPGGCRLRWGTGEVHRALPSHACEPSVQVPAVLVLLWASGEPPGPGPQPCGRPAGTSPWVGTVLAAPQTARRRWEGRFLGSRGPELGACAVSVPRAPSPALPGAVPSRASRARAPGGAPCSSGLTRLPGKPVLAVAP